MANRQPYEIARETVKLLTARKLVPSPENYQAVYHEVAGTRPLPPFPTEQLRGIAAALPTQNPGQQKQRALLEYAIGQHNWDGVHSALVAYGGFNVGATNGNGGASVEPLPVKAPPALTPEFFEQIARLVENTLPALGKDDERFLQQAQELLAYVRQPGADAAAAKTMIANFSHRISFAAEDQAEIKETLLRLLHLLFENIGSLVQDDHWIKGQMDALHEAASPPLTLRRLDDVEQRLKDVIFKQGEARERTVQAQQQMKQMLAAFIERLSAMAESSSEYQGKIEECARLIGEATTLEEIAPVLQDAISTTRDMSQDALRTRDELRFLRENAEKTEEELTRLHRELDRVSLQARHDPLTGALNRRGLDEVFHREISAAQRKGKPLCVALLDLDNFKKLNERLGHAAGDAALAHLAAVAKESLRPQDTVARYGGEEFVIVLPDSTLEAGITAMARLQRELTTRFFLRDNEKVLITFSAGVAQLADGEAAAEAVKRADQAMYLAKRAGKNRVLGA